MEINWNGPGWSIGLGAPNSALTGNNTPNSETVYNGSTPVTFTEQRSTQTKWIDLFGWGTSGKESRPVTIGEPQMQPWCYYGGYIGSVTYQSQYGPASGNLTGNWDWGANSIYNPKTGKTETNWRTPTKAEWECLIESTSKYGYACFVDTRYIDASGQSRVRYLSGIVLIPTGFVDPMCAQSDENTSVYNRRFKTSAEFTQEGIYTQNIYKYDGTPANARVENSGRSAGNGVRLVRTVTE